MPIPNLTLLEWQDAHKQALARALQLTKSKPKALEIRDAAVAAALAPDATPWDPARETFAQYLCDLVWSRYGNESKSYRVTRASDRITDETDRAPPSSRDADRLMVRRQVEDRTERLRAELRRRIEGDALVQLLVERHDEDYDDEEPADDGGGSDDVAGDEGEEEEGENDESAAPPRARERVAEPPTTRRALAKGYTLKEIKNARERLKRHALAVAQADPEMKP